MSEIVDMGLSQFHGSSDEFELLIAYSDGREIGHLVRKDAIKRIAEEFADHVPAALAAAPAPADDEWLTGDTLTPEEAWTILCETPDVTSPEEYPDHALITQEQLRGFMERAASPADTALREENSDLRTDNLRLLNEKMDQFERATTAEERLKLAMEALEPAIRSAGLAARDELVERMAGDGTPDNDLADYLERIVDACARAALASIREPRHGR